MGASIRRSGRVVEGDGLENRSAKAPGVRIPPPPQCGAGRGAPAERVEGDLVVPVEPLEQVSRDVERLVRPRDVANRPGPVDRVQEPLLLRVDRQVDVGRGVVAVDQHRRRAGGQVLLHGDRVGHANRDGALPGIHRRRQAGRAVAAASSRYTIALWRSIVPRKSSTAAYWSGRGSAASRAACGRRGITPHRAL